MNYEIFLEIEDNNNISSEIGMQAEKIFYKSEEFRYTVDKVYLHDRLLERNFIRLRNKINYTKTI